MQITPRANTKGNSLKIVLYDFSFRPHLPGKSGLSSVLWEYVPHLVNLGIDVHVVGSYQDVLPAPVEGATIHVHPFPRAARRNVFGKVYIVALGWFYIKKHLADADLIHTFEYLSSTVLATLGSIPIVLTVPGNIYERIESGTNPYDFVTTIAYKYMAKSSARSASAIIAISENEKKWWNSIGAVEEKLTVLPYGVNVEQFHPDPQAVAKIGWQMDQRHFLFVGRLSREKGVGLLLKAFIEVYQDYPDAHLHIIGDGDQQAVLEALLNEYPQVRQQVTLHGWVVKSDLPVYYAAAYCTFVPSYTEPLGRVVMEAFASGTPVIGSRVGGIPDLIHDGETGYLFSRGDVNELANSMRQALDHPDKMLQMSQNAAKYAQDVLAIEKTSEQMLHTVYEPITNRA